MRKHNPRAAARTHLGEEVEVADEGGQQDDGHVARVEELDGVLALLAARLEGDVDLEALQVDDDQEHQQRGRHVGEVGQVLAEEGVGEGAPLVGAEQRRVHGGDDGALELGALAHVEGGGREAAPEEGLADVGHDEQVDACGRGGRGWEGGSNNRGVVGQRDEGASDGNRADTTSSSNRPWGGVINAAHQTRVQRRRAGKADAAL